jgi:thiamine-monophosphate kinase
MARGEAKGEFGVIAKVFAPLALHPGAFGLRDDAAILPRKSGLDLVVTTDAIVEGVHFLSSDPPDLVARKLLRVNVSDLAAKGARPTGYFLTTAFPRAAAARTATAFGRGLAKDQKTFGLALFGGDTVVTSGPQSYSCTMFGYAPRGRILRRAGAKPGDDLWVTGTIGDSGAGLALFQHHLKAGGVDAEWLKRRYQIPEPPCNFGLGLVGLASAAMDVSDGLLQDAGHLAHESGVALSLSLPSVPLSPQMVRVMGDTRETRLAAIVAGDDYQILFAAPSRKRPAIEALAAKNIVRVSRIGAAESGAGVKVLDERGRKAKVDRAGYTHF